MNLDLEELAAIIEQLDQADFTELHYEKGDFRLHVRRGGHGSGPLEGTAAGSPQAVPAAPSVAIAPAAPAPSLATPAPAAQAPTTAVPPTPASASPVLVPAAASGMPDAQDLPEGHVLVRAPMLGTFYGAPKPGAAPFVTVGDTVGPDTTLCIIEVMKLMNSVPAGVSGEITQVFLSNGDLAEFDQPLFAVKVAA
ncbi:biotin/lipoyl-containing protein [Citricoccus sp.]|uniref:acetyl-CoA carboxylase biotin carboxyl carrier protein n=1 Tax=Citricoccus sp. TaxID=1978372 RepID=UPI002CCEB5EA|nr:biotin/lipoyl-containing protein [Citricoccus sp.]HRO95090.1 hypothetical protein [Citricoccus sp.]